LIWHQLTQIQQNKNINSTNVTKNSNITVTLLPKNEKLYHKTYHPLPTPTPPKREKRTVSQSCLILILHAAHGQTVDAGSLPGTYGHNL
jgi:hypothetical protein